MKINSTILLLLISLSAFAQFPAPTNFSLQGQYIELGQSSFCLGSHPVTGPSNCSSYSWEAPTETTTATLDHYNVYSKYESVVKLSFSETSTSHWSQAAPLGDFWVTAVYTNPTGESLPSNVAIGWTALPTENKLIKSTTENIIFNYSEQTLKIRTDKTMLKLNLINSNGRVVKCIQNNSKSISISELPKGFYIVEVYCENADILRQKIVK